MKIDARTKHWVTFRGIDIPTVQLAKLAQIAPSTLTARIRAGWPVEASVYATTLMFVRTPMAKLVDATPECKAFSDLLEPKVRKFVKAMIVGKKRGPGRPRAVLDVPVVAAVPQGLETLIQYILKRVKEGK